MKGFYLHEQWHYKGPNSAGGCALFACARQGSSGLLGCAWQWGWGVGCLYKEGMWVALSPRLIYGVAAPVILTASLGPRDMVLSASEGSSTQSSPRAPCTFPCPMEPLGTLMGVGSNFPLPLQIFIHFLHLKWGTLADRTVNFSLHLQGYLYLFCSF